ncbi:hypothetical protein MLD38_023098 [Melastoma candidum]|uniref:Uncharacterized protein n=1 Tax=Melastoma candidum TaxID=119954 RepID=A0ACB9QLL1_9MYRT|nr:hypothetical protein MLD38_023098 [Melastoma candidum]
MDQRKDEPASIEPLLRLSGEVELASVDKATPTAMEKVIPQGSTISFLNDRLQTAEATKVPVAKVSSLDSPCLPHNQSPSSSPANNHLVYVRRRLETEAGKASNLDSSRVNPHHQSPSLEDPKLVSHTKEPKNPSPPNPVTTTGSVGKPSTSGHRMSNSELVSPETDEGRGSVASPIKRLKVFQWEERFHHLQQLLLTLDQSDRKDYLQMLRSLSSTGLSQHAVKLERRLMQLSLEEAKEMQRVGMLNVLGKSNS